MPCVSDEYCPYCDAPLMDEGPWFIRDAFGQNVLQGHIFRCPNHQGFSHEDEAERYAAQTGLTHSEDNPIVCESNVHHVSGSFYVQGNTLRRGYPC